MDVVRAYEHVSLLTSEIKGIRENVDEEFDRLFLRVTDMAEVAGVEIKLPRNCRKQTLRDNVPTDGSTQSYYKRSIFIPFLDNLVVQLNDRFKNLSCQAIRALCLLPANLGSCTEEKVADIITFYGPDMPAVDSTKHEIRLWKRFWADQPVSELLETVSNILKAMNARQFPCVHAVLQLLLMLPLTSAEVERAHSALKLVKTKLRSTIGEDRLNALLLLYYHKDIALGYDKIVDLYARRHPRRMSFINPLSDS